MNFHDIGLIFFAFLSELLGTLSGFGSSTFFVPAALFVESFHFVLALTAILHCFGNLSRIILFRESFQWRVFVRLALPFIFLTGVGAVLTNYADSGLLKLSLGIFLILVAPVLAFGKLAIERIPVWAGGILSGISGFLTGFVGTGGAIRGIALAALRMEKNSFVALSSSIDVGGDLLRALVYVKNGYMDWSQWFYIPLLWFAAILGARLGKLVLNRVNQTQFERIVAFFVFLSGIALLHKK